MAFHYGYMGYAERENLDTKLIRYTPFRRQDAMVIGGCTAALRLFYTLPNLAARRG